MMAEKKCDAECPYEHQIRAAYEKLITGNGDLPIVERVRNLEDEMSIALPILQSLEKAADRQEGRDIERLANERKRDNRTQQFRFWLTTILAIIGLIAAAYVALKGVDDAHKGVFEIPSFYSRQDAGQIDTANSTPPPQDATIPRGRPWQP